VSEPLPRGAVPSRRLLRLLLWAVLVLALVAVAGAAAWSRWGARREPPPVLGEVPPFSLVNRDGRTVTREDLAGAPWIADFVFTRCAASCPMMTDCMARLAKDLDLGEPGARLHLVSFTVDPGHDTPAVLAAYAGRYKAPPAWLFLTGPQEALHHLSRDGFKLAVAPAGGPANEPILHSTRFVLVDARGRIRGYYDGFDREAVGKLEGDLRALE
jgi:protein SCO1/2